MKKLVIIVALLVTPLMTFGQSIFDKYEDMDGVASVIVNQKMFNMIATIDIDLDDKDAQEYLDMVKKITGLKVFTTDDSGVSADMKATVNKYLKSSSLDELMRIKDGDQTVKFYVKEGKDENHVKELLMFITGLDENVKVRSTEINTVVVSLTGDIDLNQISKLTSKMDIPGGEHLKNAGKKN